MRLHLAGLMDRLQVKLRSRVHDARVQTSLRLTSGGSPAAVEDLLFWALLLHEWNGRSLGRTVAPDYTLKSDASKAGRRIAPFRPDVDAYVSRGLFYEELWGASCIQWELHAAIIGLLNMFLHFDWWEVAIVLRRTTLSVCTTSAGWLAVSYTGPGRWCPWSWICNSDQSQSCRTTSRASTTPGRTMCRDGKQRRRMPDSCCRSLRCCSRPGDPSQWT